MPTLTLKFKDNIIAEYPVKTGQSLTIGRLSDNNVVVENLAVSGHHAKLDSVGDGYLLTDLQSKNHTFVNAQMITSHWLKHGDVVTVGKHTLLFTDQEGAAKVPEGAGGDMDKTMVMDTSDHRQMVAKSAPAESAAAPAMAMLSYLSGGEGEIPLSKKLFKIGKAATNDIVVGGLLMGQTAATISQRPNGYFIAFVGGRVKPKVNGEVVKDTIKLNDFDTIEVGSAKMQFLAGKSKK
ncbi:FHA domain-containing protein [Desulfatibacillum aliphaticivorans]|uniref:FHA domain containing protein n=1 Tax=Desulfatibacillum aliphaticivorans TaxID=218208 RepID=B8FFB1_DESAL|nr:FHA domain-containing protein [Desulfatibacillum aliphaticivorans]ACL04171.1 FHA domain containing protein [Desulfatibacillum aliphaticivorans]